MKAGARREKLIATIVNIHNQQRCLLCPVCALDGFVEYGATTQCCLWTLPQQYNVNVVRYHSTEASSEVGKVIIKLINYFFPFYKIKQSRVYSFGDCSLGYHTYIGWLIDRVHWLEGGLTKKTKEIKTVLLFECLFIHFQYFIWLILLLCVWFFYSNSRYLTWKELRLNSMFYVLLFSFLFILFE